METAAAQSEEVKKEVGLKSRTKDEEAEPLPGWNPAINEMTLGMVPPADAAATSRMQMPSTKLWTLPWGLRYRSEEIHHHGAAVQSLLGEVNALKHPIDHGFRDKLYRGVLGTHWEQWAPLREIYGEEALINAFSKHPEVVRKTHRTVSVRKNVVP